VTKQVPSRRRYRLSFAGADPALAYVDNPRERTISLGNGEKHFFDDVIWSHGAALDTDAAALGTFDDGSVGLSAHPYGRGTTYLLGLSPAESVLLPQTGGSYNAERQYANGIEPSADVVMLLLKAIYESRSPISVTLSTVPYGAAASLVLTHDVDAQTSFLVPENAAAVKSLKARGWDIGSHTVSHLSSLGTAPEGDPDVTLKTYTPQKGITVWGEVKVSKELLDTTIPGQRTISYRSGDLAFPDSLIRVLQGAGYRYDSTYSANAVLTAFPFFAFLDQAPGSEESSVVEVPVTLDDSQGYLTATTVDETVRSWLDVVRASSRYGGVTVLLMHPSDTRTTDFKLRAQEALMRGVAAMGGWMGDLTSYGRFWRDRAQLHVTAGTAADGATLPFTAEVRGGVLLLTQTPARPTLLP